MKRDFHISFQVCFNLKEKLQGRVDGKKLLGEGFPLFLFLIGTWRVLYESTGYVWLMFSKIVLENGF